MVAAFAAIHFTAAFALSQATAQANSPRNTLADFDPGLIKKSHAFGPLFSDAIAHTDAATVTPHDLEDLQIPDGTRVRVLVKAPAPPNPAKILKVAPIAPGQTPNEYFATAITQAYGWAKDDPIGWFDNVLGFHGTTPFQSLSHAPWDLKDDAPKGTIRVSDLAHVGARFVIRNNQYLYNRARGILLQSSFGLLENNIFIGQTGHGLILGVASDSEGPGVQNVIVRGNHFSNTGSIPQIEPR